MKLSDINTRIPVQYQTMTIVDFLKSVNLGVYDKDFPIYLATRKFMCDYTTKAKDIGPVLAHLPEIEKGAVKFACFKDEKLAEEWRYKENMVKDTTMGKYPLSLRVDGYGIHADIKGAYGCHLFITQSYREINADGSSNTYCITPVNIHMPLKGMIFMVKFFKERLIKCYKDLVDKL